MKSKRTSVSHIWTVGHSTRTIEAFIDLLESYEIARVVDIRTVPRSRHNPQYNQDVFPSSLKGAGIQYEYLPKLGGLRHSTGNSINTGWRNSSFRNFADYMSTDSFQEGLEQLIELSKDMNTTIMCAEAVPWRCHRSLVSDALVVRKVIVEHIISTKSAYKHVLTPWAQVEGLEISYPAPVEPIANEEHTKE